MFTVVITEKGGAQRRMDFDKGEVTIGRVQGNDIILPKGNVSKRHSRIVLKDSRFIVVDLKSTNGTYVNGRKITSPLVVKAGDKVYIGDFILTVEGDTEGIASGFPPGADGEGRISSVPAAAGSASDLASEPAPPPSMPPPLPRRDESDAPSSKAHAQERSSPDAFGGRDRESGPDAHAKPTGRAPAPPARAQRAAIQPPQAPTAPPPPVVTAPQPRVAPPSGPLPAIPGNELRALMARVGLTFDLGNADPYAFQDQSRWLQAQSVIETTLSEMIREDAFAGEVDSEQLVSAALREAVGLGALEALLSDETVREIIVEGPRQILADYGQGLVKTNASFSSSQMLLTVARRLVAQAGEHLDPLHPVHETTLPYGPHVVVVQPPVAVRGPVIEIRRSGRGLSAEDIVSRGTLNAEMLAVIAKAIETRRNVVVAGVVGSGVTTLLGALVAMIPQNERIVVVEDVPDLSIERDHVVSLSTGGGVANLALGDVLKQAVRLRADRLVVDDVRGPEAFAVLTAIAARREGNLVGVHTAAKTDPVAHLLLLARLDSRASQEVLSELLARAAHLVVQLALTDDGHRVVRITEVTGARGGKPQTKDLFVYENGFVATGTSPSF